jgi:hypothetical protein
VADLLVPTRPVLTVRQPHADLTMLPEDPKDVENRSWPVSSTLPQWGLCEGCGDRYLLDDEPPEEPQHRCGRLVPDGPFPFRLWIHAATKVDRGASDLAMDVWLGECWQEGRYEQYHLGALLGSVLVTGCHHADDCAHDRPGSFPLHVGRTPATTVYPQDYCSLWAEPDVWHWTLADPEPLAEPIPMKGRLGLWRLPDDVEVPA